jgi:ATP-dependent helicase/DNAse subunit B
MLWHAARALPKRRAVLVWGYPRLGRDEVAFIDAVAGEGSVLRLPYSEDHTFYENRETAEELKRRGWAIDKRPPQASWDVEVPVEAHVYSHLEAEVRGALAQVKVLLTDSVCSQDIVLVARDDASYGPTVLSVAHEYGVPVQAFYKVGLSDTRVGYWLNLLLEAMVQGFPFEATARFLAHPLGTRHPERTMDQGAQGAAEWTHGLE